MTFVRHGQKELTSGSETGLTKKGFFQSAVVGAKREPKDSINIEHSPTLRTVDTGETIELSDKVVGDIKENDLLGHHGCFSKEFVKEILSVKKDLIKEKLEKKGLLPVDFESKDSAEQEDILNNLTQQLTEKEKVEVEKIAAPKQLKKFVDYESEKPDKDTLSPKELAMRVKDIIDKYIEEIKDPNQYKPNSIHETIHVTHDFHISTFLYFVSEEYKKMIDEGKIEENNPTIKPCEGFEVIIKGPSNDKKTEISLFFRGKEYPLDLKVFEEV
ncbi:hypothetical protein ACFL1Y_01010 [Patescibacteria group bacterium]